MSKKVLLIGCGELGSRHLQSIATLNDISEIHIVDPDKASLDRGKSRLAEVSNVNSNINFEWHEDLKDISGGGDLCIIATQAQGRKDLIMQVAEDLGYTNFLIEKIVTQSLQDYDELLRFCEEKMINVWVNLKTRTYAIHQYVKTLMDPKGPILFYVTAGNHGLANNGIHEVDLFAFYDGSKSLHAIGEYIDPTVHTTKRGGDILDLSGSLCGYSDKGSQFTISFAADHKGPELTTINTATCRFMIDHMQRFAYISSPEEQWQWRHLPIEDNWMVSFMTKAFVSDIFLNGKCDLPTLQESYPSHKYILGQLLPHFNRLLKTDQSLCPVT